MPDHRKPEYDNMFTNHRSNETVKAELLETAERVEQARRHPHATIWNKLAARQHEYRTNKPGTMEHRDRYSY